jgi:methylmalonyl-CoA mutase cobalamin-binding domain/chain
VLAELRARGAGDVRLFLGGTIPSEDHAGLLEQGVTAVFTADMPLPAVVAHLAAALPAPR